MVNKTPDKHQKREKSSGRFGNKKPKAKPKGKTTKPTRKASRPTNKPKATTKATRKTTLTKEYLVGGKVVKAKHLPDAKGDGVLHLKQRVTSRSTKYTWED